MPRHQPAGAIVLGMEGRQMVDVLEVMVASSLVGTGLQRGSLPEELLQGPASICFQGDAASNWTHCLRRDAALSS